MQDVTYNPGIDPRQTKEVLDQAKEEFVEEKQTVTKDSEEKRWKFILDNHPGVTVNEINRWKAQFKKIYFINLGTNSWIFRALSRLEHKAMQMDIIKSAQASQGDRLAQVEEHMAYQEALVRRCVLSPRLQPEDYSALEAGTLDALQETILFHSNFLPPDMVISLTEEIV